MNFGASHLGQTTAVLRKDAKRMTITLPIVHAAPKSLAEAFRLDLHSSPRSEVLADTKSFSATQGGITVSPVSESEANYCSPLHHFLGSEEPLEGGYRELRARFFVD